MTSGTDDDLHAMVQGIVDELEAAVSGTLYDVNGDDRIIDDIDDWKKAEYEKLKNGFEADNPRSEFDPDDEDCCYGSYEEWMEDEIGTADDIDEPDSVSLDEYIDKRGLGDTRFEVDTSMRLSGGRTLFTFGGPNIWVHDDEVCGYWGSSQCTMCLNYETKSALFSWFEELWGTVSSMR